MQEGSFYEQIYDTVIGHLTTTLMREEVESAAAATSWSDAVRDALISAKTDGLTEFRLTLGPDVDADVNAPPSIDHLLSSDEHVFVAVGLNEWNRVKAYSFWILQLEKKLKDFIAEKKGRTYSQHSRDADLVNIRFYYKE